MQYLTKMLFLFFCLSICYVSGQTETSTFTVPTTNPKAIVQQKVAATDIEIIYNRPTVRGRQIFGNLVPYDQVWRTGSDASTKISFSTSVLIEGKAVVAGTYELFTIPGKEKWIVILQESHSQWGSYGYDAARDVMRCVVTPMMMNDRVESFTISIDDVKSDEAILNISWDQVRIPVKIKIDLKTTVLPELEALLQSDGRRPYFLAAMFYYENNLGIDRAAELMALAINDNPGHIGMLYRQALILERKGDIAGAKAAAEQSLSGTVAVGPELQAEYTRLNNDLLARLNRK